MRDYNKKRAYLEQQKMKILFVFASYLYILQFALVEGSHCYSDELECSGSCIHYSYICDGISDCLFDEDEYNCEPCRSSEYTCSNGYCILQSERCDGYNDCLDNSDEYCSTSSSSGSPSTALIVGLTIMGLLIIVAIVLTAIGGHRHRRSRQRLIRTAPQMIHQPLPSSDAVMYVPHLPPPEQLPPPTNNYPHSQYTTMEQPPPYSVNPEGDDKQFVSSPQLQQQQPIPPAPYNYNSYVQLPSPPAAPATSMQPAAPAPYNPQPSAPSNDHTTTSTVHTTPSSIDNTSRGDQHHKRGTERRSHQHGKRHGGKQSSAGSNKHRGQSHRGGGNVEVNVSTSTSTNVTCSFQS